MWSRELGTIWSHTALMVIRILNEKVSCNLNLNECGESRKKMRKETGSTEIQPEVKV